MSTPSRKPDRQSDHGAFVRAFRSTAVFRWLRELRRQAIRRYHFDYIFADITSCCNLRCPFCYNDWKSERAATFMSKCHFRKVVDLIPLVIGDRFYLSCNFEPTLHPDFLDLLGLIPRRYKRRVVLTTNLTTSLPESFFPRLARAPVGRVNISVESLDPETYMSLRRGARWERFVENLQRLAAAVSADQGAPRIRFITLASKRNLSQIPSLVASCATDFHAFEHEIRPLIRADGNAAWLEENDLSTAEWERLGEELASLPHRFTLHKPQAADKPPELSRRLLLGTDGTAEAGIDSRGALLCCHRSHLDTINHPRNFFRSVLKELRSLDAKS